MLTTVSPMISRSDIIRGALSKAPRRAMKSREVQAILEDILEYTELSGNGRRSRTMREYWGRIREHARQTGLRAIDIRRQMSLHRAEKAKLYASRAALRDCLEQMERTPKSAVSPDFIAAIDDGRKALEE